MKCEEVIQGEVTDYNFDICSTTFTSCIVIINLLISRCMASTLVRTGFVRGSMTQGNGCYQHRCTNNSLEVNIFHSASLHYAYFAFFGSRCPFLVLSFLFLECLCYFLIFIMITINVVVHIMTTLATVSILVFLFPYFFLIRYIKISDVLE